MKCVIVGSGNVATVLATVIQSAGHEIVQIVSRSADHAQALASKFNVHGVALTEPHFAKADIYIISLSDSALESIQKVGALKDKLIVHTAGSISIDVLENMSSEYGVLYPLQSLSKSAQHIPEIPFLIEGNTSETLDTIKRFATTLSGTVISTSEAERLHYHVAAVFAGNFTNHLYAIAEDLCQKEKIDFKVLLPLINEVTLRMNQNSPGKTQTGPAIREDVFTLNKHLQALTPCPDMKYLYLKLSESIMKFYGKR